jgi:isopenicillin N synthase-like dioxygenase
MTAHSEYIGSSTAGVLAQILDQGFARVRLKRSAAQRLATLHQAATDFFALEPDAKLRYGVPNRSTGYRPHAYAHAGDPDRPDLNDSFLYWPQSSKTPPNSDEITGFLAAAESYRLITVEITRVLLAELRDRYRYQHELPFENASVLQINNFGRATDDELLQQPHEDAVFLTVIWASARGLEAVFEERGELLPLEFPEDEVIVMPGSVMTAMTGGEIPPLFHLARNHGIIGRKSIMYFMSPDANTQVEPFLVNEYNQEKDIRELVLNNPQSFFGLAEDFVTN